MATSINSNDIDEEFNIEMLISEVEKRPPLYDITSKEYSDRSIKQRLWGEVCQNLFRRWNEFNEIQQREKGKEVQNKWRNLKDRFRKELALQRNVQSGQAAKKKRKYYYFDNLLFLLPSMGQQQTISNIESQNAQSISESSENIVNRLPASSEPAAPRTSSSAPSPSSIEHHPVINKKKGLRTFEEQLIDILKHKSTSQEDIDEDKSFAYMLIPMMKKLNEDQKFFAKTEILRVMRQAKTLEYVSPVPVCTYMPYTIQSYLPPQNTNRGTTTYNMSTMAPSPSPTLSSSTVQSLPSTTPTPPPAPPTPMPQYVQISTEKKYAHDYYEQFGESINEDSEIFDVTNM